MKQVDGNDIEKDILDSRGESNVVDDNVKMINPKRLRKGNYIDKIDKIKIKNFKKRRLALSIVLVSVISASFIIGGSFAISSNTVETNSTSKVEAATMKLVFQDENKEINLNNGLPQTDNDALVNNDTYEFNITNSGNIETEYTLVLNNSCTTSQEYKVKGTSIKPDLCIPDNYIKVGLSTNNSEYKILKRDMNTNMFVIEAGIINPQSTNKYKLKIWLDLNTPNDYNSKGEKNVLYSGNLDLIYNQVTSNIAE